jgi:hypothetical protein
MMVKRMRIATTEGLSTTQKVEREKHQEQVDKRWEGAMIGLLFSLAAGFHFYGLGDPSLWFDEAWSMTIVRKPFDLFWHVISTYEPNMGLYYLILYGWIQLLGWLGVAATEFLVRAPSVLFSSFSCIFMFVLARRFLGSILAGVVTFLFIVNVQILAYVQQTRSYGLLILLLTISWYVLILLLSATAVKKWWWAVYIFSTALAFYAHLFTSFVIAAQLLTLVGMAILPGQWRRNFWQRWQMLLFSLIITFLLILPELWVATRNVGNVNWLPRPAPTDLYLLFRVLTGQNISYFLLAMTILVAGIGGVLIMIISHVKWWSKIPRSAQNMVQATFTSSEERWPWFWLLCCWLAVPALLSYAMSLGTTRYFSLRYLMVITPAFCLMVGLGLASLRSRGVQIVLSIQLLLLAVFVGVSYYPHAQIEDWRGPTQWLQARYQAGDGIVCYDNIQGCQFATEYYFTSYPQSGAHYTPDTPGYWNLTVYDFLPYQEARLATDPQALTKFAANHSRIFYIVGRLSGPQTEANAAQGQAFLDSHYRFVEQYTSGGVSVRLYMT